MKLNTLLGTASAMVALVAAGAAYAHDSNPEVEKTYDLAGFEEISIKGVYHIDVQVGQPFSIKASGSKKDMDKVEIYVEDGVLILDSKNNGPKSIKLNNNEGIDTVITLPSLEGLEIAGVASGNVRAIDADDFQLEFAGVGEMTLSGKCGDLDVDMAGIGELDARGLKCEDVNVDLAGMGEASVYASERVDADAAGMGEINVYGDPEVVQKSSAFMAKVHIR